MTEQRDLAWCIKELEEIDHGFISRSFVAATKGIATLTPLEIQLLRSDLENIRQALIGLQEEK